MKLWIEETMNVSSAWVLMIPWGILGVGALLIGLIGDVK